MRKEVSDGVIMTRDMSEGVIKVLQIFNPTSLLSGDLVRLVKVLKVFVICVNFNWICGT